MALKTGLGYEEQLFLSTQQSSELGTIEFLGVNSGTYTANNADVISLAATPRELVAMVEEPYTAGAANIVLTIVGTNAAGGALTGIATIKSPSYARDQSNTFPRGYTVQVETAGVLFKTITSVTPTVNADAVGVKVTLFALPPVSSFYLLASKTELSHPFPVRMPENIRVCENPTAFVKPGEYQALSMKVACKNISYTDGLARFGGVRLTGLIKENKEGKVVTCHKFLLGLVIGASTSSGESQEPNVVNGDGAMEDVLMVVAQGP